METKVLVIGDTHFRKRYLTQGREFIQACQEALQGKEYDFIVLLGDMLDTNDEVHTPSHKLAEQLIEFLSSQAELYVLIGNHDLINNDQFLTDEHIFTPFKKWPRVTIVDTVVSATYNDEKYIFCPYVPKGRFKEALDTLEEPWQDARCIFAHQEFHGCVMNGISSTEGDKWSTKWPPVVSGHIHESHVLKNIHYTGSAMQIAYNESPKKALWEVLFEPEKELVMTPLELGIKIKKTVDVNIEQLDKVDWNELEKYDVKLVIRGSKSEIATLRKDKKKYRELQEKCQVHTKTIRENNKPTFSNANYLQIFNTIVGKESELVQELAQEFIAEL